MNLMRQPDLLNSTNTLARLEAVLISSMALLLPFDHWFFGHMVNPAPMRILGLILTAVWILQIALGQARFQFQRWHWSVVLFLAVCTFSAIFSPLLPSTPAVVNYQIKLIAVAKIAAALAFLMLACQCLNKQKLVFFLRIHLSVGTIICFVSLLLYFLHLYHVWPRNFALWVDKDIYNFVRIQGVSFEPQRFGAYMLTQIPFFLSRKLRQEIGWRCTWFDYVILLVMMTVTILSYAVSTYIVMPIMLVALLCTSKAQMHKLIRLAVGVGAIATMLVSIPAVRDATFEIIDVKLRGDSMNTRQHNWRVAAVEAMFVPWTGVGPEGYSYFYPYFDYSVSKTTPSSHPPHSIFFGLLANTGIPGVLGFLVLIIWFCVSFIKLYRSHARGSELAYTLAIVASAHMLMQATIWLPWSLNQWLYMAMAWAAARFHSPTSTQYPNA